MDILTNFVTFVHATIDAFSNLHVINKAFLGVLAGYGIIKVLCWFLQKLLFRTELADDPTKDKYDKNKVYLHIFMRNAVRNVPNPSSYALKLETWLRMAGIEHEVVETRSVSRATQQVPYIFHKGKEITDSSLIIEYLEKEFEIDSSEGLTQEQQAISRAFNKMIDDSTLWTLAAHKSIFDIENTKKMVNLPLPGVLRDLVLNNYVKKAGHRIRMVGTGRKSPEEVYHMGKEDMRAISTFLGDKKFLMGDRMTRVDCAIFGHLSVGVYNGVPSPFTEFLQSECKNMAPYMARIKEKCWPDWNKYSDITFGV